MKKCGRAQFLWDVFVTALEGGIGYWSTCEQYRPNKSDGTADLTDFSATIVDTEGDSDEFTINATVISKGLRAITKPGGIELNEQIMMAILLANRSNDAGLIDATAADCIVQAGLFGEVIYG